MKDLQAHKRYEELAEKFLNGNITPEEEEEYHQWYQSLTEADVVAVPGNIAMSREAHRQQLLSSIQSKMGAGMPTSVRPVRRTWYKWVAAASIFILAAGAVIWFTRPRTQQAGNKLVQQTLNDIDPGTNVATLKLANGQTIILDSTADGRLRTADTEVNIVKNDNQLQFDASGHGQQGIAGYNQLSTPRGSQQQLKLEDGTRVWLNALSSIRFPSVFAGNERNIEVSGEVYLEVAKDAKRPFTVTVNNSKIQVLGTAFNVMAYPNEGSLETTLVNGSVKFINGNHSMKLLPGQQSRLGAHEMLTLVEHPDVEQVIAWKNGYQMFNSADIHAIMRQVERWYDVDVEIKGVIPGRKFSGEIPRTAKLSELLQLFSAANINFTIDAQKKKLTVIP